MIVDFEELTAERNFFWTVVYTTASEIEVILTEKWIQYAYCGILSFENFWESFNFFYDYLEQDISESEVEIFLAKEIWKYKCEQSDRIIDPEIRKYLLTGGQVKWLSAQRN
jgi:hypothetical protein